MHIWNIWYSKSWWWNSTKKETMHTVRGSLWFLTIFVEAIREEPYETLNQSHMDNNIFIYHLLEVIPLKKVMILCLHHSSIVEDVFHPISRQKSFLSWEKRRSRGVYAGRGSWLIIYPIHFHDGMQRLKGIKSIIEEGVSKRNITRRSTMTGGATYISWSTISC